MDPVIQKLVEEGKTTKICLNCKYSYIQEETGFGYCKFVHMSDKLMVLYLRNIEETYVCNHWEKKDVQS